MFQRLQHIKRFLQEISARDGRLNADNYSFIPRSAAEVELEQMNYIFLVTLREFFNQQ